MGQRDPSIVGFFDTARCSCTLDRGVIIRLLTCLIHLLTRVIRDNRLDVEVDLNIVPSSCSSFPGLMKCCCKVSKRVDIDCHLRSGKWSVQAQVLACIVLPAFDLLSYISHNLDSQSSVPLPIAPRILIACHTASWVAANLSGYSTPQNMRRTVSLLRYHKYFLSFSKHFDLVAVPSSPVKLHLETRRDIRLLPISCTSPTPLRQLRCLLSRLVPGNPLRPMVQTCLLTRAWPS